MAKVDLAGAAQRGRRGRGGFSSGERCAEACGGRSGGTRQRQPMGSAGCGGLNGVFLFLFFLFD